MTYQNVGRPKEKNTLTGDGTRLVVWISKTEKEFLDSVAKKQRVSRSEVIRRYIYEMTKQNSK